MIGTMDDLREDFLRGMSARALSVKYDVPKTTIQRWAKKFEWAPHNRAPKRQVEEERATGPQDGPENGPENGPDFYTLRRYAKKLLGKADQLLDLDEALAPRDLKSISGMLLDVRNLLGTMSPLEEEEQRLRLAALKKQTEEKEQEQKASAEVVVRFVDTEGAQV